MNTIKNTKKIKKIKGRIKTGSITAAAFILIITSCNMLADPGDNSGNGSSPGGVITAVSFNKKNLSLSGGTADYLALTVTPPALQLSAKITWDYDHSVISIHPDSYGVIVTGVSAGNTYIKATTSGGISTTCIISVQGPEGEYIGPPYIYSNRSVIEMAPGTTDSLSASLYGGQPYDLEDFSWSVSDPSVISISYARNSCHITASRAGTSRITASHPKSPYPYSFIVYCRSDDFKEPYLTTESNIIVINKADNPVKGVSVSIVNAAAQVRQGAFTWEPVPPQSGPPVISVTGNGQNAVVTALNNGIGQIRISYEDCQWPLEILIRVTTAVQNVFVTASPATLEVTGSANTYTLTADVEGYNGYADPGGFIWEIPDTAAPLMDWQAAGNTLYVTGKLNGHVKIRVRHPLSEYARSALIILRSQEASAIDSSMFITTSSNYVQTKAGAEPTAVQVTLSGGVPGDEQNFIWTIDGGEDNGVIEIQTNTGGVRARTAGSFAYGNLYITPRAPGAATVTITHPKVLYQTEILVKVYSANAQLTEPAYLVSDANLVRILNGQSSTVTVSMQGNFQAGDVNGIAWQSENPSAVSVSPPAGPAAVVSAKGSGNNQTYVTASHAKAQSDKRILILSADTQEALDAMKGFYSDTTYYRINEGSSAALELQAFGLDSADINSIQWTTDDFTVAAVQKTPGNFLKASVTGAAPGNAVITASLPGTQPAKFYIAVLPEGENAGTILPQYLTTANNSVLLSGPGQQADVRVTGVNLSGYEMASTSWISDNAQIASAAGSSGSAAITANAIGRTKVHVSNPSSSNSLALDVKVGALYEWEESFDVYITTAQDTYTLVKGETVTVGASLVNSAQSAGFLWSVSKGSSLIDIAGSWSGSCVVETKEAGIAEITVSNGLALSDKQIFIIIANTQEELGNFVYLTTNQNVITVGEQQNAAVTISVAGSPTPVVSGYHWQSTDSGIADVVSSGQMSVVYGKNMGTAKLIITNDSCLYPLEIIVNVVDPVAAASNPYIMSPNIITLTLGDGASTLTAQLIGGLASDTTAFTWQISDPSIASLYPSNDTAQARALKEGVTQIIISHPKANGIDRTILVLCEPRLAADCYITTTESIIRMSPTDQTRIITATLINGAPNDSYNFKWWADSYDCININSTGASASIAPIAAGMTTVHISHPKAQYEKDIIVYVSQYSELAFSRSSLSIPAGTQTFVNMEVPVSAVATRLSYSAALPGGGGSASHIVSAGGTNLVCIVNAHSAGTAVITAQLIASNSGIVQGTAELLVNVTPSSVPPTYINYAGSNIITLEKGVTKNLSATLVGQGATEQDSLSLQWKSSDQSALKITPSSASGTAVNNQIQVTALKAGVEATVTISHEKAASAVILYFVVPGENAAAVSLDRNAIGMMVGDNPTAVTATLQNAQPSDITALEWTVEQDSQVIQLSGTGRRVNILPLGAGTAAITVRVPSSGRTDTCEITVDQPHSISFNYKILTLYPGESRIVEYSTVPLSEMPTITWSIQDNSYAQIGEDDRAGRITVYGKREGSTILTGTTASGTSTSLTVRIDWGDDFNLSKSMIKSVPVNYDDGSFEINYDVSPVLAEIHVAVSDTQNLRLKSGTYTSSKTEAGTVTYIIGPEFHKTADPQTGYAAGTIYLDPLGETIIPVIIAAYNPAGIQQPDGSFQPYYIDQKTVAMQIFYTSLTFVPSDVERTGGFSRFDYTANAIIVGDGEQISFLLTPQQINARPADITAVFVPNPAEADQPDKPNQKQFVAAGNVGYRVHVYHLNDYNAANGRYGFVDPYFPDTDVVMAIPAVGTVTVSYKTGDGTIKEFSFPVYVEVRNCDKNYQ
jgi:hypothetical protein